MPKLNGNRGRFLLSFGFIYVAIGLTYMYIPQPDLTKALAWLPHWFTIQACGTVWMVAGIVAMVLAFVPIPYDRYGFMALAGWAAMWAAAWLISFVVHDSPVGYVGTLVFAALAVASWSVAGMANPVAREVTEPPVDAS